MTNSSLSLLSHCAPSLPITPFIPIQGIHTLQLCNPDQITQPALEPQAYLKSQVLGYNPLADSGL